MKIDILTLFKDMYDGFLNTSIIKSARDRNLVDINVVDFREYSKDKHKKVDDTPYGGGAGMVLTCQPIFDAVKNLKSKKAKVILMTPQGVRYNQSIAKSLSKEEHLILICGHYEGFDERIRSICDMELSIGDYVLTGGELPSMVICDSVTRLIPGVIEPESYENDSFTNSLLDYPTYTKPREYEGMKVPDVLLSGDHKKIYEWRLKEQRKRTLERRPDIMKKYVLLRSTLKGNMTKEEFDGRIMNPKNNAKKIDVISVKNLKIVEEKFQENVTKKNIERHIQKLVSLVMRIMEESNDPDDDVLVLNEADRVRAIINNEYSKILGCDYYEVSAKNGSNISLIFEKMINKMIAIQIEKEKKEREEIAKMPKDKSISGATSTISNRKVRIANIPGRKSIRNKKKGCC